MKNSIFLEMFVTEFVEIVQDFEVTTSFKIVEDHSQEVRMPMVVTGFVMDCDDHFVYLSPDNEDVTQALPVDSIKHIAIVEVDNPYKEILDSVEVPGDNNGFN